MTLTSLNENMVFSLTQALQLVGIAPCIFVMAFLLSTVRYSRQSIVPIFYFLALSCSFLLPLLDLYPGLADSTWVNGGLLLGQSTVATFGFLLIFQFIHGKSPPWQYWLLLALPLVGGGVLLYANMLQSAEFCYNTACYNGESLRTLYHIFASAILFLLLITRSSQFFTMSAETPAKQHKYWLVVSLIGLHLLVLAIELFGLAGKMNAVEIVFIKTLLRLTFIYLVLTSLFRVFYPSLANEARVVAHLNTYNPDTDKPHVERIKTLLETDKIYREMRLNRAALAEKLEIGEHYLSRMINHHFGKNFNELINGYRIEEAKTRLTNEPEQQITVIGFEVGFNSIASFNRVFKEKAGMSPTQWREKKA